ncbi:MAG: FeoB small GTPase domain-containing protein [Thiolinea sp.]
MYLNIVDANTLERGLYLTLQLREMNVPMIVLLNMMDVAERNGMVVDVAALHEQLGCPVVAVSLRREQDMDLIRQAVCQYQTANDTVGFAIPYPETVEQALASLQASTGRDRRAALQQLQQSRLSRLSRPCSNRLPPTVVKPWISCWRMAV